MERRAVVAAAVANTQQAAPHAAHTVTAHVSHQTERTADSVHTLPHTAATPPSAPPPAPPPMSTLSSHTEAPLDASVGRGSTAPESRKRYGGKSPACIRHIMSMSGTHSDAQIVEQEQRLEESLTNARVQTEATASDAPAKKRTRVAEGVVFNIVPYEKPPVDEPSVIDNQSVRIKRTKPARWRTTRATVATPCEVCSKTTDGCGFSCTHKKCKARVCSAYCAGYRSQEDMNKAGGWACTAHMAHADDHAWFCSICSNMTADRNHNVITPVICCDRCDKWCCYSCVGIKKGARLPREWFCNGCM